MTTETKTDLEAIADLRCENCGGEGTMYEAGGELYSCPVCQGTRKRFPWLWRGNSNSVHVHSKSNREMNTVWNVSCEEAGCPKYVLIEAERWTDALLRVARETGWTVSFHTDHVEVWMEGSFVAGPTLVSAVRKALGAV